MTCTVGRGEIEFTPRRYLGLSEMAGYPVFCWYAARFPSDRLITGRRTKGWA